jgi:hypothetical protein
MTKQKEYLGPFLIFLGILIILIKAWPVNADDSPALFYIGGNGESVGRFPVEDGEISYSVTFENPTKRDFIISSVQPTLAETNNDLLVGELNPVEQTEKLKSGDSVEFSGQFHLNTSGFTEEQIKNMLPIVEAYTVTYNRNEVVILPVHKAQR